MKVLFLDIDGVLNNYYTKTRSIELSTMTETRFTGIEPRLAKLLNTLFEQVDAKIVLSSSWRLVGGLEETKLNLFRAGFEHNDKFIGETPDLCGEPIPDENRTACRGDEIEAWILQWTKDHPEDPIEKFAILDDTPDMAHMSKFFLQTSAVHGLREKNIKKLVRMLT